MLRIVYTLLIYFYQAFIALASLINEKARLFRIGRRQWLQQIQKKITSTDRTLWIHSSSLGEFEQGRPLIEQLRVNYPQHKLILTFFSPSGYEIRKNYDGVDGVFYLPLDTPANVSRFLDVVHPEMVFFIKYEFWANYLLELKHRNIPTYLFSAIFRPNQVFFKPYGSWFLKLLHCFDHIFVQNVQSQQLLEQHGINQTTVTGDTRFDRVQELANKIKSIEGIDQFANNQPVLVAGSTWPEDEMHLAACLTKAPANLKLILAPHEIHESHIESIENLFGAVAIRYSQCQHADLSTYRVLIIDNIGMLSSLYPYGYFAYIGGGFGKGIHNTLEAATYGLPVLFGPNFEKFDEAKSLIARGGAFTYTETATLQTLTTRLVADDDFRQQAGQAAKQLVVENIGATQRILDFLKKTKPER